MATVNAEIIAIGSELLLGQIVDTNSAWMAQRLAEIGVNLFYKTIVGDSAFHQPHGRCPSPPWSGRCAYFGED